MDKNISYKIIIISIILGIINIKYYNYNELKILSIIQFIYIVYLSLKGKIEKAYLLHVVFILSSSAFPTNLNTLENDFIMNTYSKFKIIGPISLSYFGMITIFIISLLKKIKKKEFFANDLFFYFGTQISLIILIGILIGVLGCFLDTYSYKHLIAMGIYGINIVVNILILRILFYGKKKIIRVYIKSLLIAAPLITVGLLYMDYKGGYGGIYRHPTTELFTYSIVLLLVVLYEKKYFISILSGLITMLLAKNAYDGKGVIVFFIILILFLVKMFLNFFSNKRWKVTRSKKMVFGVLILFIFMGYKLKSNYQNPNTSLLVTYKLKQAVDLLKIVNLFGDLSYLEKISSSPRVRIATIINTGYQYFKYPMFLIFGMGYGGYYRDYFNLFKGINLRNGAFSDLEIETNYFYSAHDTIPYTFLTSGLVGVLFILYWSKKFLLFFKKDYLAIIGFLWLFLVFGFSHHIALFGILNCYVVLSKDIYIIEKE